MSCFEVLVDHARLAAERDLFDTGDAVNTAARLEAAAAPGTVVVGPGTYRVTRHLVDYEALPALTLKGKAAPVSAWNMAENPQVAWNHAISGTADALTVKVTM